MANPSPEWWVTLLTLLLGGGGWAGLLQTYRWWVERRDKRKLQQIGQVFPRAFRDGVQIHSVLNRIMHAVKADQVLILEARNGGHVPTAGSKLKSSVIYEVYSQDGSSVLERWQDQPLDEYYITLLLDVAEKGEVHLIVDDLPQTPLRDVYVANKVRESRVIRLRGEEGAFFYMSLTWVKAPRLSSEVIGDELRVAQRDIQTLFESRTKAGLSL